MAKILVADDKDYIRKYVVQVVKGFGHEVVTVEDGVQGFELLMAHNFDVVITDESMGGEDKEGSRMMIRLKEAGRPLTCVIAISDKFIFQKGDQAEEARLREQWGVTWLILLPKPFSLYDLQDSIEDLLALPV